MCDDLVDDFAELSINGEDASAVNRVQPKCWQMCPFEEMAFRERNGLLHRLELKNFQDWDLYRTSKSALNSRGGNARQAARPDLGIDQRSSKQFTDKSKAVKQFKRSSAGQNLLKPDDIRPSTVLRQTVDYLLVDLPQEVSRSLAEPPMLKFGHLYDFAFDRLRAVRQDMVVQRLVDQNCIYILEKCIEFYAYSHYTWQHFQSSKSAAELRPLASSFDAHLNRVHLTECLNLLLRYYDHFEDTAWSLSRPLFEAIFLIFNIEANHSALKRYQLLKQSPLTRVLFNSQVMQTASKVLLCYSLGNHIKCLRLVGGQYCRHPLFCVTFYISNLSGIHLQLLQQVCTAFRSANTAIALTTLAEWFCPEQRSLPECVHYIERLAQHFHIPIECPQVDHFNFDDGDGGAPTGDSKKLLIKHKFATEQWRAPADLHPSGWLPQPTNFYRVFFT